MDITRTLIATTVLALGLVGAPTAAGALPGGYSTPLPRLTVELDDTTESAGLLEGRLRLSSPIADDLSVPLGVRFPDAGPWDVAGTDVDVDIPAGATELAFDIGVVDGDGPEAAELIGIEIEGAHPSGRVRTGRAATAVIYDGDGLDLALVDDPEAAEGDPGTDGTLDLVVAADQAVPHDVTFRVRTSIAGGYNAATSGVDLAPVDVVVELPAGETGVTVAVPLVGDQLDEEPYELFFGTLSEPSHGEVALSGATTVARIIDDDGPVVTWERPGGYQSSSRSARSAALTA